LNQITSIKFHEKKLFFLKAFASHKIFLCRDQVNGEMVEIRLNIFRARINNTLHGFTANSWRIPSVLGAALAASTLISYMYVCMYCMYVCIVCTFLTTAVIQMQMLHAPQLLWSHLEKILSLCVESILNVRQKSLTFVGKVCFGICRKSSTVLGKV
jgi:hypothetical protein